MFLILELKCWLGNVVRVGIRSKISGAQFHMLWKWGGNSNAYKVAALDAVGSTKSVNRIDLKIFKSSGAVSSSDSDSDSVVDVNVQRTSNRSNKGQHSNYNNLPKSVVNEQSSVVHSCVKDVKDLYTAIHGLGELMAKAYTKCDLS